MKTQTKHTPGIVHKIGCRGVLLAGDAYNCRLCRLRSVAPDLLEALRRIGNNAAVRKWNGESNGPDFDAFTEIEGEARAAIAKAEGQQEAAR